MIVPIPAPTVCRCRATDGMCHGWEGETWWPVTWQAATAQIKVRLTFALSQETVE